MFSPFVINKKQKTNMNILCLHTEIHMKIVLKTEKYIKKKAKNCKSKNSKKRQRHNLQRLDPGGGGGGKCVLRRFRISV